MKLRDMLNRVKNSSNNQSVWNPKKRKLKEINLSEEELLNLNIDIKMKRLMEI